MAKKTPAKKTPAKKKKTASIKKKMKKSGTGGCKSCK